MLPIWLLNIGYRLIGYRLIQHFAIQISAFFESSYYVLVSHVLTIYTCTFKWDRVNMALFINNEPTIINNVPFHEFHSGIGISLSSSYFYEREGESNQENSRVLVEGKKGRKRKKDFFSHFLTSRATQNRTTRNYEGAGPLEESKTYYVAT